MMYRFKISKYRNATAKLPKKEGWITDINASSSLTHGNLIKCSSAFVAFHQERPGGGILDVLPLDFKGKIDKNSSSLSCHSDLITDFDFSPFDDGLLTTASQDCTVKFWNIPQEGLQNRNINPVLSLVENERNHRVENVLFHPTVDTLFSSSSLNSIRVWDLMKEQELYAFNKHDDLVQSFCWQGNGNLIGSSCKDKKLRIIDPRSEFPAQETSSHSNPKDSRIIWLGDTNQILSTGFQTGHERQIVLRDIRNFSNPLKTITFDNCVGILLPFFDCDTNMLFIAGKADASISFLEIINGEPLLSLAARDLTEGQTKGMCRVPKRALNVMEGEVNRLLQLTQTAVVPITYQVPRKTYRDFHADLFPDTIGTEPALGVEAWLAGESANMKKISLDPSKRNSSTLLKFSNTLPFTKSFMHKPRKTSSENEDLQNFDESSLKLPTNVTSTKTSNNENEKIALTESVQETQTTKKTSLSKPIVLPKPAVSPVLKRGKSVDVAVSKGNETEELKKRPSIDSSPSINANESRNATATPIPVPRASTVNGNERRSSTSSSSERNSSVDQGSFGSGSPSKSSWVRDMVAAANANKQSAGGDAKALSSSPKQHSIETPVRTAVTEKKEATPSNKPFAGFRVSKFRHLKGTPFHKNKHIENLRNLSTSLPRECDGIHGNKERVAVVLKGPGGRIAILELSKTGRIPDGVLPSLQNVANVMDFCWDPFDDKRLAVACDDAVIRLWLIPEGGLTESQETPKIILRGHTEKVSIVKFHPLAEDILASCSLDLTVRIWDVFSQQCKFHLSGHSDQIFSLDWSQDGKFFATASKDNRIRIFEPRASAQSILKGSSCLGNKGARIKWVLQGKHLLFSGFDRVSERQIKLFSVDNLNEPLATVALDVSPAILIPFYDEDSSTVFFTGKGDSTIFAYEVLDEPPYLFPLSHHKCASVHQGLTFLPKIVCDVRSVEFARALRLTGTTIEPISFTVPRVKMDIFQSDLFPSTRVLWEPLLTKDEWVLKKDKPPKRISLQPEGMQSLDTNKPSNMMSKSAGPMFSAPDEKSNKQKQQDLVNAMSTKLELNYTLEQDSMEGVDPAEWND